MAWGKKPWQGGTKKKFTHSSTQSQETEYAHTAFDFTSQYRSKREANSTIKGFISMLIFVAILIGSMWGLVLFFHWVGVTF